MSIHAMTMVLDFAPEHWNTGTRLVAIALADRVGEEWTCWPSIADLADRTGLSTRQVRRCLLTLQRDGVIGKEQRRRVNGSQQSNLWIWLWKHEVAPPRRVTPMSPPGVKPMSPPS